MIIDRNKIIQEITVNFSLSNEEAKTACLLLEARARTLDFTFEEYMKRYHPEGLTERDEKIKNKWRGYVRFLGEDATAILKAGKGANFSTFVHECAHVFRRQLVGNLQKQTEKAFGVENGIWTREKEELFAKGMEQWLKQYNGKDKTRKEIFNKGKSFINTIYHGMERIIDIDSRMEAVYKRLFENTKYKFKQNEYEKTLKDVSEGKLPEKSHVFLGMTPWIYEELGFQRLPMAMTGKHLYSTYRANGELKGVNYHDLGEEIMSQLPEQLKKPICIVQSSKNKTEIVSIIGLKDKNGDTVIVPIAQYKKGNFNGAEIDINLVKSLYGKEKIQNWLKTAIEEKRLLYIDKKEAEPVLKEKLTGNFLYRSVRFSDGLPHSLTAGPTTDVFGFLPENITHYKEIVKQKYQERNTPSGKRILYQSKETDRGNNSIKSYLSGIKIENINDFKRQMKTVTQNYPNEFGNNSMKCAGVILDYTDEKTRDKINFSLRALGCTNMDKTKKIMELWAVNGIQNPLKDIKAVRNLKESKLMER
jgi:hypothetical protein